MVTFVQIAEIFNLFTGIMLTVAILVFAGGLASYFPRLGTWPSYRDSSIKVMEWAVAILFVLVVIMGIVQYFERYPKITSAILAIIILVSVAVFVMRTFSAPKKEEGGEH